MSDGSLSQEEIDALLMDDFPQNNSVMPDPSPAGLANTGLDPQQQNALLMFLGDVLAKQGAALSSIMLKNVKLSAPKLNIVNRQQFLQELSDEVIEIRLRFQSGLGGIHSYFIATYDALSIASPMMGQDGLELDATSINAVGEAMNQMVGVLAGSIEDKIKEQVMTDSPDAQKHPRDSVNLPEIPFVYLKYEFHIGDQGMLYLHEIFEMSLMQTLLSRLGSGGQAATNFSFPQPTADQGTAFNGQNLFPGTAAMNSAGAQGTPNFQGVQLPHLNPAMNSGEQRNIGLLMDVSMELTVELGRTKWQIKDILTIGEGTIVELDKLAGEPADILINNNLIARGEVVVIDENFGVRVTEIISSMEKIVER